ncbi:MAG: lipopolysaccharide transport periplasmic protein LptA [Alphaproteobacteria bacterium]
MTATRRPQRRLGRRCAAIVFATGLVALALLARAQVDLGEGYDTSLPIEISADSLEVQQDLRKAVFRGNVDAVQGELKLRADQLTVHYRSGEDGENSVSRIEADGNVFLSSPAEMAQGDWGVYDVDADMVELTGSVVLTRGENVIKGNHLTLNLATGRSRMESGAAAKGGSERVKALFVPKSESE